jgi:[NiFe] hydrogenase diaphorase moiety small subunit
VATRGLRAGLAAAVAAGDFAAQVCPVGAILPKRRGFTVPIGQRRFDLAPVSAPPNGPLEGHDEQR